MGTHTHTVVVQCAESYSWKSWKVNTGPERAAGGGGRIHVHGLQKDKACTTVWIQRKAHTGETHELKAYV